MGEELNWHYQIKPLETGRAALRHLSQHVLLDAIQILGQIVSVEQGVSALRELEFSAFISAS